MGSDLGLKHGDSKKQSKIKDFEIWNIICIWKLSFLIATDFAKYNCQAKQADLNRIILWKSEVRVHA